MDSGHRFGFVDAELDAIRRDNLYRRLRRVRPDGAHIIVDGRRLLNLCSNDYLGIPATAVESGQLQSSSRLVSGNDESYADLEDALASHKAYGSSLVYPTGYMANLGAIPAVAGKGDLILSDELNHASIIDACRLSGARVAIYRHNDTADMEKKMGTDARNKFVITEGVFSMDGDLSPLREISEVAQKAGAITIVDDAHGDFVMGNDGRGTPDHVGADVDMYVSSLSKGLGSFGGYVAARNSVTDLCINRSKAFIYTSALPSFVVRHALGRFGSDRETQRLKLQENTAMLSRGLEQIGFDTESQSQIIPVIIGDEKSAVEFGEFLHGRGIFAQPIRYPTVPRNKARIRLSVTAWLERDDIEMALGVFEEAYAKLIS